MLTKNRLLLCGLLILFVSFYAVAQYTGSEMEVKKPASLFPGPGPGEREIVNQLQEANRLLQQNNQLLSDQNRLLRDVLRSRRRR